MSETTPFNLPPATVHALVHEDGTSCAAFATKNVWLDDKNSFAPMRPGNEVIYFPTGKAYFEDLQRKIASASREIYIAGWQVNWDCQLAQGVRLYDVLVEAARRNIQIRIMPWDDTSPVQTYDDATVKILESINDMEGVSGNPVQVNLAKAQADSNDLFYSHHQKQIVIDREVGYVGGIDLAYGRYDDEHFYLKADHEDRRGMNRYNPCIYPIQRLTPEEKTNPIPKSDGKKKPEPIAKSCIQVPDCESDSKDPLILDPSRQPRMPWHDAHCRIKGPAVADLLRNFIDRWNCTGEQVETGPKGQTMRRRKWPKLPPAPPASSFAEVGSCSVQVLRSAPACLREDEANGRGDRASFDAPQDDIMQVMMRLICGANHFIYIENQFFVSDFGRDLTESDFRGPAKKIYDNVKRGALATRLMRGDADQLPQNKLCEALAGRIGRAILDPTDPEFHVYLVLPVHPEGRLDNGPVAAQVHNTMQTLVFGSQSLLNRVRRFLKAKELRDQQKDSNWERALLEDNVEYRDIGLDACNRYVTLLNLRHWTNLDAAPLPGRYVTEQIYVHSKLMVIDDRFALLGSANINDRSQLGGRDSELAVLVVDTNTALADVCGTDSQVPVRGFARDLRQQAWSKLFGISCGVRAATELSECVARPADSKTWRAIQEVAAANTLLYEEVFPFIPRDTSPLGSLLDSNGKRLKAQAASLWPTWDNAARSADGGGRQSGPMPFEAAFWNKQSHAPTGATRLENTKGFITALPTRWTEGEHNRIPYHGALVSSVNSANHMT